MDTNIIFYVILAVIALVSFVANAMLYSWYITEKDKNRIHLAYAKRISVKKFLALLEEVKLKAIDQDTALVFQKYFELVLLKIDYKNLPNLMEDLDKSIYSGIMMKALARAAVKDEGVFGLALAENIENPKNKLAIQYFLTSLPKEERIKQNQVAYEVLKQKYDSGLWDYSSEYRKPTEEAMEEFKKKLKNLKNGRNEKTNLYFKSISY
jgi:hypothetical protein